MVLFIVLVALALTGFGYLLVRGCFENAGMRLTRLGHVTLAVLVASLVLLIGFLPPIIR